MDNERFISTILRGSKHEILPGDVENLDIIKTGENKFHVISGNKSYNIEVVHNCFETKQFVLKVNGKKLSLSLEDEFDLKISKMGYSNLESRGIKEVKAPMPGMVFEILVEENAEVKKGDPLLILEAMKMENIIKSPTDGAIQSLEVSLNQAVNKNQILLKFK